MACLLNLFRKKKQGPIILKDKTYSFRLPGPLPDDLEGLLILEHEISNRMVLLNKRSTEAFTNAQYCLTKRQDRPGFLRHMELRKKYTLEISELGKTLTRVQIRITELSPKIEVISPFHQVKNVK